MNKSRGRNDYGWSFSSSAIGMSRLLDATDIIFTILENCGGDLRAVVNKLSSGKRGKQ